jgi:hypothetical protein
VYTKLHEIYVRYVTDTRALAEQAITDLHTFITAPSSTQTGANAESQRKSAGGAAADALPPLPATEAAQKDEVSGAIKPD